MQFNKVTYYSVVMGKEDVDGLKSEGLSEVNKFIKAYNHTIEFQYIKNILFTQIGNKTGIRENYFRHEGIIDALPGYGWMSSINSEEDVRDLRLYLFRLNNREIILFNGGFKSKRRAQECPNVKSHFDLATRIVRKYKKADIEIEEWLNDELIIESWQQKKK